jgi:hypothetical protein
MTCTTYCVKIEEIFDAMIRLAYEVLPENRRGVNLYIASTWHFITVFVQSIKREKGTEELRAKFESHVAAEEARLRRNFEDLNYRIDDSDTLRVIAGEGRIEMVIKSASVQSPIHSSRPRPDSFPDVLPCVGEGSSENQSRSKARPYRSRDV